MRLRLNAYISLHKWLVGAEGKILFFKFKVPKSDLLSLFAKILPRADKIALRLKSSDQWPLLYLSKTLTAERFRDNPWTYESTIREKMGDATPPNSMTPPVLKRFQRLGIADTKKGSNGTPMWKFSKLGRKTFDSYCYIQAERPEIYDSD